LGVINLRFVVFTYQDRKGLVMRTFFFAAAIAIISLLAASPASFAQDPNITAKYAIGEIKSIDAATKQLTIKTDAGAMVSVTLSDKTTYKKLAPGEQSLANATDLTFADLGEGDRVMARGSVSADQKTVPALQVIVMTKGDLAKKQEAERLEWRRRGILGVITALKPDTKEITISNRTMAGTQSVVIPVTDKTEMRRYAPDSIRFADAKPSEFSELKVGDQLRALGDRTDDPLRFNPQKVVTGSFRTVGGVVSAVDPATGEIQIKELEKKTPLTIVIKQNAVLRRFPSEMGAMGGMGRPGGGPGGAAPAAGNGAQAQSRPAGAGGPGAGGPGGRPGFNINDMLERLPTISIADVKVGDTIIVSSTQGVDPTRLTAISLVAGADTLLAMLAPRPAAGQAPNPAAGLGGSGISFGIGLP
jgi:Cu/Ag efflux protein CusF